MHFNAIPARHPPVAAPTNERGAPQGDPKNAVLQGASLITGFALFIIVCMGAAGHFPGAALGYSVIGLTVAYYALTLAAGNFKERKIELIGGAVGNALMITGGALCVAGVISSKALSWIILGTGLVSGAVAGVIVTVVVCATLNASSRTS